MLPRGARQGQVSLPQWGLGSQGGEQFGRSATLVFGVHDHLSFRDHVHEFDPNQSILGGAVA